MVPVRVGAVLSEGASAVLYAVCDMYTDDWRRQDKHCVTCHVLCFRLVTALHATSSLDVGNTHAQFGPQGTLQHLEHRMAGGPRGNSLSVTKLLL